MTTLIVGSNHEALLQWCQDHVDTGAVFTPESTRCVALLDDDNDYAPIAVVALDGWTVDAVEATITSDGTKRWANRRFISAVYEYVFDHCGKNRLNTISSEHNDAAIKMNKALGHVQEGYLREWFGPGESGYMFSFLRSDWVASKWTKQKNDK
jgi:RimJ/RimL family protein N-acetyltransferase